MHTGVKIRKIREQMEFSQEYMADRLNISQKTYSYIENGRTRLYIDRLEKICKILETEPNDLMSSQEGYFKNSMDKSINNNSRLSSLQYDSVQTEKSLKIEINELQEIIRELTKKVALLQKIIINRF